MGSFVSISKGEGFHQVFADFVFGGFHCWKREVTERRPLGRVRLFSEGSLVTEWNREMASSYFVEEKD